MNLRPFPKPAPFIDCALAAAAVQERLRAQKPAQPEKRA
jgi:hypothetical protein